MTQHIKKNTSFSLSFSFWLFSMYCILKSELNKRWINKTLPWFFCTFLKFFVHVDILIPPPGWTSVDFLLTPPPPLLVHLVVECPLTIEAFKTEWVQYFWLDWNCFEQMRFSKITIALATKLVYQLINKSSYLILVNGLYLRSKGNFQKFALKFCNR